MNKRLTKPYDRNVRLEHPTGLVGVPPKKPYIIIAELSNTQLEKIVKALTPNSTNLPQ